MSLRIAAALAVTIGIVVSSPAQARPEMVGMRSAEYSPGTIVVKTGERRLYLILDSGRAMRYPDRKSTRLNSSHIQKSRMPSSA